METERNTTTKTTIKKEPSTVLKVTVLIGLIVLLILGILLPIKLVPNAVSSLKDTFSSLFGKKEVITLSTDRSDIMSGDAFTLSWTGTHKDNGTYVLSYTCKEGVRIETSVSQPHEMITCDAPYFFPGTNNKIELTAFSDTNRYVDIPVSLGFLASDTSDIKELGNILVTVTNTQTATSTSTTAKPATTTPTTPDKESMTPAPKPKPVPTAPSTSVTKTYRVSNPNGTADLALQITDIGYLDGNARFISSPYVYNNMIAAVKFVVTNKGDKNTGPWSFTADLPSIDHPTYTAQNLQNLGPGDSIVFTLGFVRVNTVHNNTITITVDPQNFIPEINNANNTSTVHLANYSY